MKNINNRQKKYTEAKKDFSKKVRQENYRKYKDKIDNYKQSKKDKTKKEKLINNINNWFNDESMTILFGEKYDKK